MVGYKGANEYDSGIFYCPYVPMQLFSATGQEDFGKRLGIKSRYGLISNPYYIAEANKNTLNNNATAATNSFYRSFNVTVD